MDEDIARRLFDAVPPDPPQPPKQPPKATGSNGKGDKWRLYNDFIEITARDLTLAEQAVWFQVFRDAYPKGRMFVARTAQSKIAACSGLSVRHVKRAVKRLKALGLLQVLVEGSSVRGIAVYRLSAIIREEKENGQQANHLETDRGDALD